jgi:hypothetical protein
MKKAQNNTQQLHITSDDDEPNEQRNDFDFEVEEFDDKNSDKAADAANNQQKDEEEKSRMEQEILFCV